jgi:hypothetical protein
MLRGDQFYPRVGQRAETLTSSALVPYARIIDAGLSAHK